MRRSSKVGWFPLCTAILTAACGSERDTSESNTETAPVADRAPADSQDSTARAAKPLPWTAAGSIQRPGSTLQAAQSVGATHDGPSLGSHGVVRSHRRELAELAPTNHLDFDPVPLCRMVRHPGYSGYGLYEVTGLTAYIEQVAGQEVSATYVELTRVQDFHQAESTVVARVGGGPMRNGALALWNVNLKLGESVAVLGFVKPWPGNLGYPTIDATHVFKRRADGGYGNGQLFTQRVVGADELGKLVAGLAGRGLDEPCPYDEQTDRVREQAPAEDPQGPDADDPGVTRPGDDA